MATSGNYTFNMSRDQIIDQAAIKAGILDPESGALTPVQRSNAALNLNTMIMAWQADGLQIWKRLIIPITTVADQVSYTLGPSGASGNTERPIRIVDGYVRQTGSNDTPLWILTEEEYNRFGQKNTTGLPTQLWYHPLLTNGVVKLYPVPDAVYTVFVETLYPYQSFVDGADTADFPTEWLNALVYNLAVELAYDYGVETKRLTKLEARADFLHKVALGTSQENSVYFQPSYMASGGYFVRGGR